MKNKMKVKLIFIIILFLPFIGMGCWNRRDPEKLTYVLAAAFDLDNENEKYHLIVQVARPLAGGDDVENGMSGGTSAFWVFSSTGKTPFDAMRNLAELSTREIFWAHNRVVLFSERIARDGLVPIMDMLERERQMRTIVSPAIVEGDIRKLMEAPFPLEDTGGRGISRQIHTIEYERSIYPVKNMTELYNTLVQPGIELFIGKIHVIADNGEYGNGNDGNNNENGNSSNSNSLAPPARIGGGALFKGDSFVGWADVNQTMGWQYALGKSFKSTLVISCPVHEGALISVETFKNKSDIRPVINNGDISFDLIIRMQGRIQNYLGVQDLQVENTYTRAIEEGVEEKIYSHVDSVINMSKDLNSDIIGFGNIIYRKHPHIWREIGNQWDDLFPDLDVNVKVHINVRRTGLIFNSIEF